MRLLPQRYWRKFVALFPANCEAAQLEPEEEHFFDLIRSGQVKLMQDMLRPEEGIVPLTGLRAYLELGPFPSGNVSENLRIVSSIQKRYARIYGQGLE